MLVGKLDIKLLSVTAIRSENFYQGLNFSFYYEIAQAQCLLLVKRLPFYGLLLLGLQITLSCSRSELQTAEQICGSYFYGLIPRDPCLRSKRSFFLATVHKIFVNRIFQRYQTKRDERVVFFSCFALVTREFQSVLLVTWTR